MTDPSRRALERVLGQLERQARRPRRGMSPAPFYLALGLVVGYQLLVRFVPLVWSELLPSELANFEELSGLPGLVWRLGATCTDRFPQVLILFAGLVITALAASRGPFLIRSLVWLAAIVVVVLDAGILVVVFGAAGTSP